MKGYKNNYVIDLVLMDLEFSKSTTIINEMYDRVSKYLKEKSNEPLQMNIFKHKPSKMSWQKAQPQSLQLPRNATTQRLYHILTAAIQLK